MSTIGNYHYSEQDLLGKGAFGKVYKGHHTSEKYPVAIKCVPRGSVEDRLIKREIGVLIKLTESKPKNLVRLLTYASDSRNAYLVMEYCNGGNLRDYLETRGTLEERIVKLFMKQLAFGMRVLNDNEILHRDLKPDNILLKYDYPRKYPPSSEITLKIADFGLSRFEFSSQHGTQYGTPAYWAPEVEAGNAVYTIKVDLWSLGVITYECLTGNLPSKEHSITDQMPRNISSNLQEFLIGLLRRNPKDRMTFSEFYNHAFLR